MQDGWKGGCKSMICGLDGERRWEIVSEGSSFNKALGKAKLQHIVSCLDTSNGDNAGQLPPFPSFYVAANSNRRSH